MVLSTGLGPRAEGRNVALLRGRMRPRREAAPTKRRQGLPGRGSKVCIQKVRTARGGMHLESLKASLSALHLGSAIKKSLATSHWLYLAVTLLPTPGVWVELGAPNDRCSYLDKAAF